MGEALTNNTDSDQLGNSIIEIIDGFGDPFKDDLNSVKKTRTELAIAEQANLPINIPEVPELNKADSLVDESDFISDEEVFDTQPIEKMPEFQDNNQLGAISRILNLDNKQAVKAYQYLRSGEWITSESVVSNITTPEGLGLNVRSGRRELRVVHFNINVIELFKSINANIDVESEDQKTQELISKLNAEFGYNFTTDNPPRLSMGVVMDDLFVSKQTYNPNSVQSHLMELYQKSTGHPNTEFAVLQHGYTGTSESIGLGVTKNDDSDEQFDTFAQIAHAIAKRARFQGKQNVPIIIGAVNWLSALDRETFSTENGKKYVTEMISLMGLNPIGGKTTIIGHSMGGQQVLSLEGNGNTLALNPAIIGKVTKKRPFKHTKIEDTNSWREGDSIVGTISRLDPAFRSLSGYVGLEEQYKKLSGYLGEKVILPAWLGRGFSKKRKDLALVHLENSSNIDDAQISRIASRKSKPTTREDIYKKVKESVLVVVTSWDDVMVRTKRLKRFWPSIGEFQKRGLVPQPIFIYPRRGDWEHQGHYGFQLPAQAIEMEHVYTVASLDKQDYDLFSELLFSFKQGKYQNLNDFFNNDSVQKKVQQNFVDIGIDKSKFMELFNSYMVYRTNVKKSQLEGASKDGWITTFTGTLAQPEYKKFNKQVDLDSDINDIEETKLILLHNQAIDEKYNQLAKYLYIFEQVEALAPLAWYKK